MHINYPVRPIDGAVYDAAGYLVGSACAERIARTLNACWHISDDDLLLPAASSASWSVEAERAHKAEADRDRLLAALKEIQANPNDPRAHRAALDALQGR